MLWLVILVTLRRDNTVDVSEGCVNIGALRRDNTVDVREGCVNIGSHFGGNNCGC